MIPGNANPLLLATAAADAAAATAGPIKSLRFNPGDSAYLDRTPSSNGNLTTSTFACWVKRCDTGTNKTILAAGDNSQDYFHFEFRSDDRIKLTTGENGSTNQNLVQTEARFRDPSAWYHVVLQLNFTDATQTDRVKIYVNGTRQTLSGTIAAQNYTGTRFNRASVEHQIGRARSSVNHLDAYLADIYFIDGSALDATSFGAYDANGVWQAAAYSGTYGTNGFHLLDFENESTIGHDSSGNENDFTANNLTNTDAKLFIDKKPDGSNWGNISNAFDGNTSTYADGTYNNGTTSTITFDPPITGVTSLRVYWYGTSNYGYNGSNVGSGSTTAEYKSVYSGSAITVNSIQGTSQPGNGVVRLYAIEVNGSVLTGYSRGTPAEIDVLFDVPTNGTQSDTGAGGEVSGNYCTFNPVDSNQTHSNGNLFVTCAGGTSPRAGTGTIAVSSGKYYYEATVSGESVAKGIIGFVEAAYDGNGSTIPNGSSNGVFYFGEAGNKIIDNSSTSYGDSYGNGDVIGVALNLDDDEITFYKNGTSQGTITTKTFTGAYKPAVGRGSSSGSTSYTLNAGQRAFAYAAPSGFKTLNTASLPTPTIADGSNYFDVDTYTGTDSALERSNFSFTPGFLWFKQRSGSSTSHALIDALRGGDKRLVSNGTNAEVDVDQFGGGVTSFDSDGFTLGTWTAINDSNETYVAWAWNGGDLVTNSAYNQSQTWSSATLSSGSNLAGLFDGSLSTNAQQTTNGTAASITNFGPITVSSTVSFYSPDGDARYTLNGGSEVSVSGTGWHDISFSGSLTSFTFQAPGNARIFIYGMKVDNKQLVDPGIIPIDSVSSGVPSIQSTVRANPTAGFSIVTYTGSGSAATVGHGLNAVPEMIILKGRNFADNWRIYHKSLDSTEPEDYYLMLESTNGRSADQNASSMNDTAPTNSVFSLGTDSAINGSSQSMLAYCFTSVDGYQALGQFTGNGSSDGPFVHTGFAVQWLLIKGYDASNDNWKIFDNTRSPFNVADDWFAANNSNTETTGNNNKVDFLSNGFKLRTTGGGDSNLSSKRYIYLAIAENPFQANGGLAR